jgi:hypothetical protein
MDSQSKATTSSGRKPADSVDGSVRPRHRCFSLEGDSVLTFFSLRLVPQYAPAVLFEPLL